MLDVKDLGSTTSSHGAPVTFYIFMAQESSDQQCYSFHHLRDVGALGWCHDNKTNQTCMV